ncbi:NAD-dependent epimerase/dehydratase family protein [Gammaproteobacteria bacterium]|nr:NAD-dependent epimerase/dehydratase family protein [Gammaproteobacteria bacterium]
MIDKSLLKDIKTNIEKHLFVFEGANGSLGLSFLKFLKDNDIKPFRLLLTSYSSNLDTDWKTLDCPITHLKACDNNFYDERKATIQSYDNPNVIFASGYGRPNKFSANPTSVISANIDSLLGYKGLNINFFGFMSTSELYTGHTSNVDEKAPLLSMPDHPRSIYIESKRLAEAIVHRMFSKTINRVAIYRVALAFPPKILQNDNRVLSDLINGGIKNGIVTLNGGANLIRQYQYGVNSIYKILGSMYAGNSLLYNNSGPHILTLGDLAKSVASILNVDCIINDENKDSTSPKAVLIDNSLINKESMYKQNLEKNLEYYLKLMING